MTVEGGEGADGGGGSSGGGGCGIVDVGSHANDTQALFRWCVAALESVAGEPVVVLC